MKKYVITSSVLLVFALVTTVVVYWLVATELQQDREVGESAVVPTVEQ